MALAFTLVTQEQAFIHGGREWQFTLNAIKTGTEHDRQSQVGITAGVWVAQFDARCRLAICTRPGNADQRFTIHTPPVDKYRRFVTWHQAFIGIDQGSEYRAHSMGVGQLPRDEVTASIGKPIFAMFINKGILPCCAAYQLLVSVHS